MNVEKKLFILYIDPQHLDDVLFSQALARSLGKTGRSMPPMIVVHGSGEAAARRLEAEGLDAARAEGVLVVRSGEEARMVEQVIRESNRKLVGVLIDAVVHAVGFQGTDRGLLRRDGNGTVALTKADWVRDLAMKGAIPVISAVAQDGDTGCAREVPPADAAVALAACFSGQEVTIVFLTASNQPGVSGETGLLDEATISRVEAAAILPDVEPLRRVVGAGIGALVGGVSSFLTPEGVSGTRVVT